MASVTLAESAKLSQDQLVTGVIENVLTVNAMFELLPFDEVEGNAVGYNRENALGDVMTAAVDDTITAKAAATFSYITSPLTTLVGDAEVNGLIQATRSNINNQKAIQIASKAKSLGRKYQDQMINGDGTGSNLTGLLSLVAAGNTIAAGTNGANLAFADMDAAIDKVTDKDGQVDWIMMPARTRRAYLALLRALGGASINEVVKLPSGREVPAYRGIPIFVNDWIPVTQTQGTSGAVCTSVLFGTFDDGSRMHGISGLTAAGSAAGIHMKDVGESETKDNNITRVVWYAGLAVFNLNGLSMLKGLLN